MTQGFVTSFDARRGTGFVQQARESDRIPFTANRSASIQSGDQVEFAVVGGKAGVMAKGVRPLQQDR